MTEEDYHTTAVSLGDLKNGMLYFDKIIPTCIHLEFIRELAHKDLQKIIKEVYREILPESFIGNQAFANSILKLNELGQNYLAKLIIKNLNFKRKIENVIEEEFENSEQLFADQYLTFIDEFQLGNLPLVAVDNTRSASLLEDDNQSSYNPLLTISNLKLIDASDAPWEQILEFRKDDEAKLKLRKLRLFAYEKYTNKPKSYIEDDINTKIYEYELTAKKFGLQLIQGALSNVVNSKLFAGLTTGSILTTVFADGLFTASIGTIVTLGQLTLEYNKQKIELQSLVKDNPASFITYYKEITQN